MKNDTVTEDMTKTDLPEQTEYQEPDAAEQRNVPPNEKKLVKKKKKLNKKRIIITVVILAVVAALIVWLATRGKGEAEEEVLTDQVQVGSIVSTVEGNGQTKAKNSESISVNTTGTVTDVFVSEGQMVTAGTLLYQVHSPAAQEAVEEAQKDVDGYEKQLKQLQEDNQNLTVRADFAGKLLEVASLKTGDTVSTGQVLAKLVDDSKMKLEQYYSYAYENNIYVGQKVKVSIPSVMQQVSGTVDEIKKVSRVSPEGSKLFCVVISMRNPGVLTEKMTASATINADGEQINPYELGELDYASSTDIVAEVGGDVEWCNLQDYMMVSAGETLVKINGEDNENELFQTEQSLSDARETLKDAKKSLENTHPKAPIDGKVIGLSIEPGQEVAANTSVITIADTSMILVDANIDERNVSYITPGMMVELDQWGTMTTGIVESVSLSGNFENGMTTFPAVISVDNTEGLLMPSSSVVYTINASQSEGCLVLPIQCVKYISDEETGETVSVVFVESEQPPEGTVEIDGSALGVPEGFYAVPVTTGISDKYNVEILSGVEEGTSVFTQIIRQDSFGEGMF